MDGQSKVKVTLRLGSELYTVNSKAVGGVSEQLSYVKEESMGILKEFITEHNVPTDVPDELLEGSSDNEEEVEKEEDEVSGKSKAKPKKPKIN
ncbi:Ribosomal RNA adenine dimethylase family protein [Hibiscus syriacus]|uniref:Ribosomal RNA adenine dimethylase family protein n=1 Tax=Hibiscus syriacus TaxID=106335 RepID=A0A6A3A2S4_HIBSY|nr:Ribosomal RNA adenine dimethylase family protein [Hibiscus syriacus]